MPFLRALVAITTVLFLHGCGGLPMQPEEKRVERMIEPATETMIEPFIVPQPEPPSPIAAEPLPLPKAPTPKFLNGRGKYFQDDGPGSLSPEALKNIPEPLPRDEPLASFANQPYVVFGKTYSPARERKPWIQRGIASWYGKKFHGRRTATGETYDMHSLSAAHPTLPLPSYVRVTHVENGQSIIVRVNDRGPFLARRMIDLSYAAAAKLGLLSKGQALVQIEAIMPSLGNTLGELSAR